MNRHIDHAHSNFALRDNANPTKDISLCALSEIGMRL